MRSIVTVTQAAASEFMTTVARVKSELGISGSENDAMIETLIEGASSRIEAELGFRVPYEEVRETFRPDGPGLVCAKALTLDRTPVAAITSVVVDGGTALDAALYEVNAKAGLLYRLDTSIVPMRWEFSQSVVVEYASGYAMPAESDANLPAAIETAATGFVKSLWFSLRRNPIVKAIDIPGLMSTQYWVGEVGAAGSLPPDVNQMIAPFVRIRL